MGDRERLKRVLLSLLSNAVSHSREGGSVQLACEQVAGERLRITVADTGPGFAPEPLELLFAPLERPRSEQAPVEDSGLGLSLSKRLAEAMGGALGVSTAVGRAAPSGSSCHWSRARSSRQSASGSTRRARRTGPARPVRP
jgi:signal transduction histidine kinase